MHLIFVSVHPEIDFAKGFQSHEFYLFAASAAEASLHSSALLLEDIPSISSPPKWRRKAAILRAMCVRSTAE